MVHGDDDGLVLPPHIAPTKVMVIPIGHNKEEIVSVSNKIYEDLLSSGIKTEIDLTDRTPGYKFSNQEVQGIPLRIEVGPKDLEENVVTIVRRDTREKIKVAIEDAVKSVPEILETMQKDMFERAKKHLESHIYEAHNFDELIDTFNNKSGFVKAMWCGDEACEEKIKEATGGATSRCIPFEEDHISDTCVCCGKKAEHMVYFGKAY